MEAIQGIKRVSDLATRIEADPALAAMFQEKPTDVLRAAAVEISDNAPVPNTFVYKAAVFCIGLALIITVIGAFVVLNTGKVTETPEWVIALTSAAIGALAGMLRT